MAGPGKKPSLGTSVPLDLKLPKFEYEYLEHLARLSRKGTRPTEVAVHILIEELGRLFESDFHMKKLDEPTDKS